MYDFITNRVSMQADTLDEVITHSDTIIQYSILQSSRMGYFAWLYALEKI